MKKFITTLSFILLVVFLVGCGANANINAVNETVNTILNDINTITEKITAISEVNTNEIRYENMQNTNEIYASNFIPMYADEINANVPNKTQTITHNYQYNRINPNDLSNAGFSNNVKNNVWFSLNPLLKSFVCVFNF